MATNPYVKFKRGLLEGLSTQEIVDGTLYLTTDEGAIYLDNDNSRVRLGDVIAVQNIAALPENGPQYQAKNGMIMYYAKDENVLARWNGSGWTQINAAGLTKVSPTGAVEGSGNNITIKGNGVSRVETDPANSNVVKVTYANFALKSEYDTLAQDVAELAEDLSSLTGTGGSGSIADRIAAVQGETTSTIKDVEDAAGKNAEDITDLAGRVTALDAATTGRVAVVESDLSGLSETVSSNHTAALNAAKAVQGETTKTVASVAAEVASNDTDIQNLQDRMTAVESVASTAASGVTAEAERAVAAEGAIQAELDATQGNVSEDYNSLEKLEIKIKANATAIAGNDQDILALQNAVNGTDGLSSRVAANEEAIAVLNGTGDGSVQKTVATAIATVVGEGTPDTAFDTLVEISEWLLDHSDDAIALENRIKANEDNISTLDGTVNTLSETVAANKSSAETAVANLKTELTGDAETYMTLGALEDAVVTAQSTANTARDTANANAGRLTTAENGISKNAEDISTLTQTVANNKSAAETLVSDAKAEIKETTDALDGRLDTAEGDITALQGRMTTVEGQASTNAEGVAANKTAIEKEVADRAAAITALDTAYKAADSAFDTRLTAIDAASTGRMAVAEANIADIFEILTWGSF